MENFLFYLVFKNDIRNFLFWVSLLLKILCFFLQNIFLPLLQQNGLFFEIYKIKKIFNLN